MRRKNEIVNNNSFSNACLLDRIFCGDDVRMKIDVNKNYCMLNVNKFGYRPWYPRNWFHNIKQFFWHFKLRRQRAKYGFCEADLWDMNDYLTQVIIEMLRNFPKNLHGAPDRYYDRARDSIEPWKKKIKSVQMDWETLHMYRNEVRPLDVDRTLEARNDAFKSLEEVFFDLWD